MTSTKTLFSDGNLICFSCVLLFLKIGSAGEDEDSDDSTAQESFELSELKYASITPFGLPGIFVYLRLWGLLFWA